MAPPHAARTVLALALLTTPALGEQKPDPAATREYAVAAGLQKRQLFGQAAGRWERFIQTYPNDPRAANAYHHLGSCQLHDKQPAKAAQTFRTLLEKFPRAGSRDAAQFNLGLARYNVALASGKPDDFRAAAAAFAELPARHAPSKQVPAALYYQAECLSRAGDGRTAVTLYRKVIQEHPTSGVLPDVYYGLATALQEAGQDREAEVTFRLFLAKYPRDKLAGECQLRLGLSLLKQKAYAEAAKQFEQAARQPDFPLADLALFQQARCLFEQKQLAPAAELYESLPKRFPASARKGAALLAAGKCRYQAGDMARAETALRGAVDARSADSPEAAYWLAQTFLKQNKPTDAVAVLDRAVADYPRSGFLPQMRFTRISALYEQPARRKETPALFAEFARSHPDHELTPRALYMAALAALGGNEPKSAAAHAEAFLQRFGRHELAGEVLFIAGEAQLGSDPARAEALYRRLLAEHPRNAQAAVARVRIGLCLYLAKKYADAVAWLTGALRDVPDPALKAEAYLVIGRSHHERGQPAEAVAALEKAAQARPAWERGDEVLLALAQNLQAQKKSAEAAERLRRLAADYPKSSLRAYALYQLGEMAFAAKKYDEALALYEQAAAVSPRGEAGSLALYAAGLTWLARNDNARAIAAFGRHLGAFPADRLTPRVHFQRALAHQRAGQFEPAARDLTAFLASRPTKDAAEARYALALCQSALGRHADAASTLAALLREYPDFRQAAQAHYERGHALLSAGKKKEAAEAFGQLAARYPDNPLAAEASFRVGEIAEAAGQWPEATRAYEAAWKKARHGALREKAAYRLGWVEYRRGHFADAARILLAQLKDAPNGELAADATYLAADSLFRQDQFAQARPLFDRLIQAKSPKYHARALYRAGACRAGQKEWAESQKCYEELLRLFPKFELIQEARYGLGLALQNQDRLDDAQKFYEQVTKATATETAARSRFMIGEIAFRQKKYRQAVEHFLEAALGYPYPEWQALGYFEAGRCLIELKETTKAIDALETVVKKYPKHPRARDAARLIAELRKGGK